MDVPVIMHIPQAMTKYKATRLKSKRYKIEVL